MSVESEVQALKNELQGLTAEVHQLQRQAASRRGPDGRPGRDSVIAGPAGPKGDAGTISKEEAVTMFREVVNEHRNEILDAVTQSAIKSVMQEFMKRLQSA